LGDNVHFPQAEETILEGLDLERAAGELTKVDSGVQCCR